MSIARIAFDTPGWFADEGLRLLLILGAGLLVAYVLARGMRFVLGRIISSGISSLEDSDWGDTRRLLPRLRTLERFANRSVTFTVLTVVLVIVANDAGVRVEPVLASAGLVGIAVAFGAQTLIRDSISGAFLLIEGTYNIGDYVRLNTVEGVVTDISLRRTRLVADDGTIHTVPNGAITVTSNFTRELVHHTMVLRIPRDTPVEVIDGALRDVQAELAGAPEIGDDLVSGPATAGIVSFRAATYDIEVRSTVHPVLRTRWPRLLNARLLVALERRGVTLAD